MARCGHKTFAAVITQFRAAFLGNSAELFWTTVIDWFRFPVRGIDFWPDNIITERERRGGEEIESLDQKHTRTNTQIKINVFQIRKERW